MLTILTSPLPELPHWPRYLRLLMGITKGDLKKQLSGSKLLVSTSTQSFGGKRLYLITGNLGHNVLADQKEIYGKREQQQGWHDSPQKKRLAKAHMHQTQPGAVTLGQIKIRKLREWAGSTGRGLRRERKGKRTSRINEASKGARDLRHRRKRSESIQRPP